MIFGAGFGTRMAPLTDAMPKPLIPVSGRPLVDHALALAREASLRCHVNAHYRAAQLAAHLPVDVECHVEAPDILDTGGGLKAALPAMEGRAVMTLNSDALWAGPNPLSLLQSAWDARDMQALLLLVPVSQTVGYQRAGNFSMDAKGRLGRDPEGYVFTGAQIIDRQVILEHPETVFSMNAVWDGLIEAGTCYGTVYPGRWADVGTPGAIPLAEAMLRDV